MARGHGALTLTEDDRRVLAAWAADCAERTLAVFERQAPRDSRPRDAIVGARAFARGALQIGAARKLAARAHAAAREVGDRAAVAAARAAGHAVAVAHMAGHAVGAPAYAALAARLAQSDDPRAAEVLCRWSRGHASPAVRGILRRLPRRTRTGGVLGSLVYALHTALTADE
jgi:hypothetical protein